jgi:transcriptional regulator with XRE-family HTH domain
MLIESEYESDAAFEREMELGEKTVSNWRRGRSSSYMRILPRLSERFGVNVSELLDMPIGGDFSDLSEDEAELLTLYRKTNVLPKKVRRALRQTLETTINMYLSLGESEKKNKTKAKKSAEK